MNIKWEADRYDFDYRRLMNLLAFPLEHFFYASKTLMFILDRNYNLKKTNPYFDQLLGYRHTGQEVLNFMRMLHPSDQGRMMEKWNDDTPDKDTDEQTPEFRVINAEGNYIWLSDVSCSKADGLFYITAIDISKYRKVEKEILDTNHVLNKIIDLIPHPIFLKDAEGKYILVNQSQSNLFGLESKDLLGNHDKSLIHDKTELTHILESDRAVIAHKTSVNINEQIITTPNGEKKILHTTKVPLVNPANAEVNILGVSIDLTEVKKVEEALKESEEKYKTLVEISPDAIIILEGGRISFINSAGVQLLQASSEKELLGSALLEFIHPDYHPIVLERTRMLKAGKKVPAIEEKFIQLNGNAIDVEVSSIPFFHKNHYAIQIIARNITDRVKARNDLYRQKQEFRTLAENSDDIIARFNRDYQHAYINQAITRYTGQSPEYFLHKKVRESGYPETLSSNIEKVIDKAFRSEKPRNAYFTIPSPAGEQFCFATIVPEKNQEGTITSVLCTVRNITEVKQKEHELLSINNELNTFIYKASHDLKGPLASILGLCRLYLLTKENSENKEIIRMIHKTATNLNGTLKRLLEIVKIKDKELNIRQVNIYEVVEHLMHTIREEISLKNIDFSAQANPALYVHSDYTILFSILKNIITNAIHYRSDHDSYIRVISEPMKNGILLSVEDNGRGIEESMKGKIFDMFFRGDVRSKGPGLGLYFVKKAIARLKGNISFESEEGKGSVFRLYIPDLRV